MLLPIMSYAQSALEAESAAEASQCFFKAMEGLGASYLQTRVYRRPAATLTSATHWAAGGFVTRIAPKHWPGSAGFNYVCFECNPLLGAIREGRTRYRFSDFATKTDVAFGAYWEAMSEAGIDDALCTASYGAGGVIASLHLGFSPRRFAVGEEFAIQAAGLVLTERLLSFANPDQQVADPLTARERDSLAFVAEGKTDWELSTILGISESTARFHVDNARRKLGAVNRAQAVARLINMRLI